MIVFFFHFLYLRSTKFSFLLVLHIVKLSHVIFDKYKDLVTKISIQINLKKAGVGQPKYCIYARLHVV